MTSALASPAAERYSWAIRLIWSRPATPTPEARIDHAMHEYSLMQDIIKSILERLEEEKSPVPVKEVILHLGVLEIHSEAAARQAFEVLAKGTPLEQAGLTLVVKPVTLTCPQCKTEAVFPVDEHTHANELLPVVNCPECGGLAGLSGGQGVDSIELVFEDEESPA